MVNVLISVCYYNCISLSAGIKDLEICNKVYYPPPPIPHSGIVIITIMVLIAVVIGIFVFIIAFAICLKR